MTRLRIRSDFAALVAGSFALSVMTGARPAAADPPRSEDTAEAKTLFDAGSRAFDLGQYDQAIDHFEKAYRLSGAPALLLNIAQAHRLAGHCGEAARFYKRFLEKNPKTTRRAEIEARRAEMEACEARRGDEKPEPGPPGERPPGEKPPGEKPPGEKPPGEKPPPPEKPEDSGSDPWRIVGWSGLAIGGAGAVLAGTMTVLALGKESDLKNACQTDGGCPASAGETLEARDRWRSVAVVGGIVAAVGAGAAILGFVLAKSSPSTRGSAALEVWLGAGQIGARGAF